MRARARPGSWRRAASRATPRASPHAGRHLWPSSGPRPDRKSRRGSPSAPAARGIRPRHGTARRTSESRRRSGLSIATSASARARATPPARPRRTSRRSRPCGRTRSRRDTAAWRRDTGASRASARLKRLPPELHSRGRPSASGDPGRNEGSIGAARSGSQAIDRVDFLLVGVYKNRGAHTRARHLAPRRKRRPPPRRRPRARARGQTPPSRMP